MIGISAFVFTAITTALGTSAEMFLVVGQHERKDEGTGTSHMYIIYSVGNLQVDNELIKKTPFAFVLVSAKVDVTLDE